MEVIGRETIWEGKFIKTSLIYYKDRLGSERVWEAVRIFGLLELAKRKINKT